MKIQFRNGLSYVMTRLEYRGRCLELQNVLLDTGSDGSIFSTDKLFAIGLQYEPNDIVHRIRGIGGSEFVFTKQINRLIVGELQLGPFEIEVGMVDYGFEIDGIIGMDFLTPVGAIINLAKFEIYQDED